jgi:hypothetical protein
MSVPTSSANISFPVSATKDEEIRKLLEEENIVFEEDYIDYKAGVGYPEIEIEAEAGIFSMYNSEARYGEFFDLEELLIKRGIPFDRRSFMDWNRPPLLRVFRPGDPPFNRVFELDSEGYEPMVSLAKIRELVDKSDGTVGSTSIVCMAIKHYLAEKFPAYPPLTNFITE